MDIYLLRHGKAEERRVGITSDSKRRLTESGKMAMEKIASGIVLLGINPDMIISSPLTRSKETAEIVSKHLSKYKEISKIHVWQNLKPESDIYQTHKSLTRMAPDARIMLVGHEPHLSSLVSSMVCSSMCHNVTRSSDARSNTDVNDICNFLINLKKGGLVVIRANARGYIMCGSMQSLMTPKQLKLMACNRAKMR